MPELLFGPHFIEISVDVQQLLFNAALHDKFTAHVAINSYEFYQFSHYRIVANAARVLTGGWYSTFVKA